MVEFQISQESVLALLICMDSQILRLERVESGTKDEDYIEEKNQELVIG